MEVTELKVVSFTLGRQTHIAKLIRKCGVFAVASYLRRKGYSLEQTLAIVAVSK